MEKNSLFFVWKISVLKNPNVNQAKAIKDRYNPQKQNSKLKMVGNLEQKRTKKSNDYLNPSWKWQVNLIIQKVCAKTYQGKQFVGKLSAIHQKLGKNYQNQE